MNCSVVKSGEHGAELLRTLEIDAGPPNGLDPGATGVSCRGTPVVRWRAKMLPVPLDERGVGAVPRARALS